MATLQSGVKRQDCKVCFDVFDSNDRRPRSLPCGHTICSKCVSDNLQEDKLVCPSCRREYQATTYTDFPVNYELENVLQDVTSGQPSLFKTSSPPSDASRGISKKLKSMRLELSSGMESISMNSQEANSQLHQYMSQMMEWEEQHQEAMEKLSTIVHQHEEMVTHIKKESMRVQETIKEGEEERQRVKVAEDILAAASTAHDIIPALEEADHCYDNLDNWTHRVQGHFPDTDLTTQSLKLRERTKSTLQTLSPPEKEEEEIKTLQSRLMFLFYLLLLLCQNLATSSSSKIQENTEAVQAQMNTILKVQDLQKMTPFVRQIVESGRVYAVQEHEGGGGMRTAKITLYQNRLCLHVLVDHKSIPNDAIFLKHSDVMRLVAPSFRLIFLELGDGGSTLGRLYIHLIPDTKGTQHFTFLCTGEMGPSYVNTKILQVMNKGHGMSEYVTFGDYERNDGSGGKALLPRLSDEVGGVYRRFCSAGILKGSWDIGNDVAAQFQIRTRTSSFVCDPALGIVEADGLNILAKVISHYRNIRDVFIQDCGIALSSRLFQ